MALTSEIERPVNQCDLCGGGGRVHDRRQLLKDTLMKKQSISPLSAPSLAMANLNSFKLIKALEKREV